MTKNKERKIIQQIIFAQEKEIRTQSDVVRKTGKGEMIGIKTENLFRDFLNNNLPSTLNACPGYIIYNKFNRSSHFDIIITDRRYPYLASVGEHRYALAESVIAAVEIKTSARSRDINDIVKKGMEIEKISEKTKLGINYYAICLESIISRKKIAELFFSHRMYGHLFILNFKKKEIPSTHFWLDGYGLEDETPVVRESAGLLSDLYFLIVQDCISMLSNRELIYTDISEGLNDYIDFATLRVVEWSNNS